MKPTLMIGIVLVVLGILALVYQGITYTTHKRVVDIGPIQATAKTHKTVPLPPVAGGLVLAGGIVLIAVGSKKS